MFELRCIALNNARTQSLLNILTGQNRIQENRMHYIFLVKCCSKWTCLFYKLNNSRKTLDCFCFIKIGDIFHPSRDWYMFWIFLLKNRTPSNNFQRYHLLNYNSGIASKSRLTWGCQLVKVEKLQKIWLVTFTHNWTQT